MQCSNIVMYPDYEYSELKEQFRAQLEAAVDLLGEAKGSVLVYVMKYFGALLPKAQAGVSYRYYQNKRFAPDVVPAVDAFTKEMRNIEARWGNTGNRYMMSESIKLYVFFLMYLTARQSSAKYSGREKVWRAMRAMARAITAMTARH